MVTQPIKTQKGLEIRLFRELYNFYVDITVTKYTKFMSVFLLDIQRMTNLIHELEEFEDFSFQSFLMEYFGDFAPESSFQNKLNFVKSK